MASEGKSNASMESGKAVTDAWPDLFANLQAAYAKVIDTQFEMERRAAELEDSRDLLRQVIASMSEALFLLDRTGRIMQVNPAALALLGCPENECIGHLFRKICPDPEAPITAWKILNKSAQGTLTSLETELHRSDGQPQPVSLSAAVVRNRNGRIDGVLIIAQDRQPQQRLQNEQLQLIRQTATANFATKIAQELAPSVDIIRGYSQHLQQITYLGAEIDEQWLADLQRIEMAANEMALFITYLQAISRPILGAFKPLDINQLAKSALLLTSIRAPEGATFIQHELQTGLPAVQGDWHELAYTIADLIDTLYQRFASQLIELQLRTWMENREVCLCIKGTLAMAIPESAFIVSSFVQDVVARHEGMLDIQLSNEQLALTVKIPGLVS